MHVAARGGHSEVVELLHQFGVDLNLQDVVSMLDTKYCSWCLVSTIKSEYTCRNVDRTSKYVSGYALFRMVSNVALKNYMGMSTKSSYAQGSL